MGQSGVRTGILAGYVIVAVSAAVMVGTDARESSLVLDGMGLLALVAVGLGIHFHRPQPVGVWIALAASIPASATVGLVFELPSQPLARHSTLFIVPDVLSLVAITALLAGVNWAIGCLIGDSDRAVALDTLILVVAVGSVVWELVLDPLLVSSQLSGVDRVTNTLRPVLDGIVIVAALRLVVIGPPWWWPGVAIFLAAAAGLASDVANAVAATHGSEGNLAIMKLGWMATPAVLGVMALLPSTSSLIEPAQPRPGLPGARFVALGASLLAPVLAGTLRVTLLHLSVNPVECLLPICLTSVLVMARLAIANRDAVSALDRVTGQERRMRGLVESLSDLVLVVAENGTVLYQSPSVAALLGYAPDSLIGEQALQWIDPVDHERVMTLADRAISQPDRLTTGTVHGRDATGRRRTFELSQADQRADPAIGGIVVVLHDVTERVAYEDELRHRALHDALTGLPNRALIEDQLAAVLGPTRRHGHTSAVLYIDLDNFKDVNDGLGHDAGDELLQAVGVRLSGALREVNTIGRLGGDEFVVLTEDSSQGGAVMVAERVLEVLSEPFEIAAAGSRPVTISASIGIASGADTERASEVLRNADVALYRAKASGKHCAITFEPSMHLAAVERFEREMDLQRALFDGQLFLQYQPIVDLSSFDVRGVEALLRWWHPEHGVLPPATFVPLAEEMGEIVPIGRWVIRQACRHIASFRTDQPLSVSVNISGRQLDSNSLFDDIRHSLEESGLHPGQLTLEVTETTLMRDAGTATARLETLKELGVRIAIDDFGTGYSSFSHLQQFPADILKIDRSFVANLGTHEGPSLVRTLVQLGKLLGLATVAEGVEDASQLAVLQSEGCDEAQGFLFARPLDLEQVTPFIVTWNDRNADAVNSLHSMNGLAISQDCQPHDER